MNLRSGYTTGTCAAAATKAAALALTGGNLPLEVEVPLPEGDRAILPVAECRLEADSAVAGVVKDAGDDPDITHGLLICAKVCYRSEPGVSFEAGPGVGIVTRSGLALTPGEPAINPAPRRQIAAALAEVNACREPGFVVRISILGGAELAHKTFNPRLGIVGGLSILGSDGRVRPFSHERLVSALSLAVDVARANGVLEPVLVPGHLGRRHAMAALGCPEMQVIEISNAVGAMLGLCQERGMNHLLLFGHPGKLAKLVAGEFDTHSSRSRPATLAVAACGRQLGLAMDELPTTEAIFTSLAAQQRRLLGCNVADAIRHAVEARFTALRVSVWLTDLAGNQLGTAGALQPWTH